MTKPRYSAAQLVSLRDIHETLINSVEDSVTDDKLHFMLDWCITSWDSANEAAGDDDVALALHRYILSCAISLLCDSLLFKYGELPDLPTAAIDAEPSAN